MPFIFQRAHSKVYPLFAAINEPPNSDFLRVGSFVRGRQQVKNTNWVEKMNATYHSHIQFILIGVDSNDLEIMG